MKEKAIVRKTNEMMDIERHWIVMPMTVSFNFPEEFAHLNSKLEEMLEFKKDVEEHEEGDHYILSDGNEYMGEELIVGVDNIRDYKITNQIKIDE